MRDENHKHEAIKTILTIVVVVLLLAFGWWAIDKNSKNNDSGTTTDTSQGESVNPNDTPAEPTNPNVTGGSSGAGTGESNDPSGQTPSPAGGTDANGVPAQ